MYRYRRSRFVIFIFLAAAVLSGCNALKVTAPGNHKLPAQTATTPSQVALPNTGSASSTPAASNTAVPGTPSFQTVPPPTSGSTLKMANSCDLINSYDLASLFPPHNEIIRDAPKTGPVSQPPFSQAAAAGTQETCLFYDFHQPGKATGWMLQVTYLVDTPDPSAQQAWAQAWSAAAKSGQPVNDLGVEAFASGANLFIKKGNTYLTFESTDTHLNMKTAAAMQQVLAYNEQLAKDGLQNLK